MVHQLHRSVDRHRGDRNLVLVDRGHRADGIPARQQNQRRAGKQRKDQAKVLTGNPELRKERQEHAALVRQDRDAVIGGGGIDHVAMGVNAALGHAGGAAGVVERSDLIEAGRRQRRRRGHRGKRRQQIGRACGRDARRADRFRRGKCRRRRQDIGKAGDDDLAQPHLAPHLLDDGDELVQCHDYVGLGIVELVGQLERARQRADGDMDRAELQDAEEHDVKLRAVRQEDGDAIALAHALGLQQCREAVALPVEIGVGGDVPVEDHRRTLRAPPRPGAQIFRQRSFAVQIVRRTRQALRPRLVPQPAQGGEVVLLVEGRAHDVFPVLLFFS